MKVYWDFLVGSGASKLDMFRPSIADAITLAGGQFTRRRVSGAEGTVNGRCLVFTNVTIATPTLPARFLFDTDIDADNVVPLAVRTFVLNQLGLTITAGTSWRDAIHAIYQTRDGAFARRRFLFGIPGELDI